MNTRHDDKPSRLTPDDGGMSLFHGYLDKTWPLWKQHVGSVHYMGQRLAFLAGLDASRSADSPRIEPKHVCGLQGFNPVVDGPCLACVKWAIAPTSSALPPVVRKLLLELYAAHMNGSCEVTNARRDLISDLLGIEAFACARQVGRCLKWCGVEGRCTAAFKATNSASGWHKPGEYEYTGPSKSLTLEAGERAYINYQPTGRWFIVFPDTAGRAEGGGASG